LLLRVILVGVVVCGFRLLGLGLGFRLIDRLGFVVVGLSLVFFFGLGLRLGFGFWLVILTVRRGGCGRLLRGLYLGPGRRFVVLGRRVQRLLFLLLGHEEAGQHQAGQSHGKRAEHACFLQI